MNPKTELNETEKRLVEEIKKALRVKHLVGTVFQDVSDEFGDKRMFMASMLAVQMYLYNGVITLVNSGIPYPAAVVIRSMYEVLATIHFVLNDRAKADKRATDFVKAEGKIRDLGWDKFQESFLTGEYSKFAKTEGKWTNSSIEDRLKGLHPTALGAYAVLCDYTHVNPWMPKRVLDDLPLQSLELLQVATFVMCATIAHTKHYGWFKPESSVKEIISYLPKDFKTSD